MCISCIEDGDWSPSQSQRRLGSGKKQGPVRWTARFMEQVGGSYQGAFPAAGCVVFKVGFWIVYDTRFRGGDDEPEQASPLTASQLSVAFSLNFN